MVPLVGCHEHLFMASNSLIVNVHGDGFEHMHKFSQKVTQEKPVPCMHKRQVIYSASVEKQPWFDSKSIFTTRPTHLLCHIIPTNTENMSWSFQCTWEVFHNVWLQAPMTIHYNLTFLLLIPTSSSSVSTPTCSKYVHCIWNTGRWICERMRWQRMRNVQNLYQMHINKDTW